MPEVLLHIGYHKTGSTFLQRGLFSDASCGFMYPTRSGPRMISALVKPHPFKFAPQLVHQEFGVELDQAQQQSRVFVLSHERLSGYPASGGYDSRTIADRLKQTFPAAKVLIVIREQRDVILSMYTQYLRDGGSLSLRRFLRGSPDPLVERVPMFRLEFYEYDLTIEYYQSAFGQRSVLVLPYELLVQDPKDFLTRIANFCGFPATNALPVEPVHTTETAILSWARRTVNTYLTVNQLSNYGIINVPKINMAFDKIKPIIGGLPTAPIDRGVMKRRRNLISHAIEGYYRESNHRTQRIIGEELGRYGYEL